MVSFLPVSLRLRFLRSSSDGVSAELKGQGVSQTGEQQGWGLRKDVLFLVIKAL